MFCTKNVYGQKLDAIVRPDNTFVTFNDTLSKKEVVPPVMSQHILYMFQHYKDDPYNIAVKSPIIYKVTYSQQIDIYVVELRISAGIEYKLFAFDHDLKIGTTHPMSIFGSYMENKEEGFAKQYRLLSPSYIYFAYLTSKHKKEIVVKERVHNGTAYNGEVDHIYQLTQKMDFVQRLCIESKWIEPLTGCLLERTLKDDTLLSELHCKSGKPKIVGKVILRFGHYVHITNKEVIDTNFKFLLITGSNKKESYFLRNGSSFAY